MEKEKPKHILLCVAGGTPAIITETLCALKDKGERVDEVRVITTITDPKSKIKTGRERIMEDLLAEPDGQFHRFCRHFPEFARDMPLDNKIRFDKDCLYLLTNKETGVPSPRDDDRIRLTDILDDRDNQRAANQICEIVRELAVDQNLRLHASVAGGRKTMGLYLMAAMQLYGRDDDVLSHVLVNAEVEGKAANFFYITPQPEPLLDWNGNPVCVDGRALTTDDAEIYLAEIPFIRLKGAQSPWLRDTKRSYGAFVRQAQIYLNAAEANLSLKINLVSGEVAIGETAAVLTGYELLLYTLFAEKRLNGAGVGRDGFLKLKELRSADFEAALKKITAARGNEMNLERCRYPGEWHFLDAVVHQAMSKNEMDYKDFSDSIIRAIGRASRRLKKGRVPEDYEISKKGSKRPYAYGLDVAPERIIFVEEAE
jgi:CRISPR-associated protein (TIGR02584 family)